MVRVERVVLFAAALVACDRPRETTVLPSASAVEASAPSLVRPLEAVPAFDLVSHDDHAVLVWADGKAIRALHITADGNVQREQVLAETHDVIELGAAAGQGLGAAWVAGNPSPELHTTVVDWDGSASEPVVISSVSTRASERRGRVALAADPDGKLRLFAQGPDESCEDGGSTICATFASHHLPADGSATRRPSLTVPHPCATPIAGFAIASGFWHYAVCNIEKAGETTVLFTAQSHPSYAQVVELLEGCEPGGATFLGDDLWLTASCGRRRAGVTARGVDVPNLRHDLSERTLLCSKNEHMELSLGGRRDRIPASVLRGAAGLAALLPADVAPEGSRAVLLGGAAEDEATTLVVASSTHDEVAIRRYQCVGSFLMLAD